MAQHGIQQFKRWLIDTGRTYTGALEAVEQFLYTRPANAPRRKVSSVHVTDKVRKEVLHLFETTDLNQNQIAQQVNVNHGRVNEILKEAGRT